MLPEHAGAVRRVRVQRGVADEDRVQLPFEELAREPPSAARRAEMREIGRGVQRGMDLETYEKGLMRAEMGEYSN